MQGDKKWGPPGVISIAAAAWVFAFLVSPFAYAHRVDVSAWIQGGRVYTESYLGHNKRVAGGTIQVYDLSGTRLVEGKTDDKGQFSFPRPKMGDLRIVLEAGMGHRAEYLLKASEAETPDESPADAPTEHVTTSQTPTLAMDRGEIQKVVEDVLDTKLAPIKQDLAHLGKEKPPGFREIMAGIGYIVGIMGLALYFRSRKKTPKDQR